MSYTLSPISHNDQRAMAQVRRLLEQEGISLDGNLDYTCGLFDDNWQLAATGSAFGPTLRCFAVDHSHQGEGLLNQILTHLVERQAERGNFHLFLYTKPETAKFFADLGFFEIARGEGLSFLENRRGGFARFCEDLSASKRPGSSAAIVMNANPFTLGHRYLVERAAAENDTLHLFILSEDASLFPFSVRRQLVASGTTHLPNVVLHDSGPYIISAATFPSYFLKDEDKIIRTHAALDLTLFSSIAQSLGVTRRYVGEEPTSHVTSLYNSIMAAQLPAHGVECVILPRFEVQGAPVSASTLRKALQTEDWNTVRTLVPQTTLDYLTSPAAEPVLKAIRAAQDVIHY